MEDKWIRIGWMLRPASFALAFAILLASAPLGAANRPRGVGVRLDYTRGAGARQCPDASLLRGEVAAEIGKDRFTGAGPWRLHAAVNRRKNGAFVATADLFDSDGARVDTTGEIISVDCTTLVKALAVWTAIQLTDPLPSLPLPAAPPSASPPPALPDALPAAVLTLPDQPSLPAAPPPLFRPRLSAATGIEFGVGPTPTPLFSLNVALQSTTVPILSLAFEVRTDLPLPATGEGGTRIHALVLTGSLLTCFHALDEGMLYWCPMFTVGLRSSGERRAMGDQTSVYSAAGGRFGAAIPFASRRLAFTLAGDVLGTLRPYQLLFEERTVLWQTASVAGALQVGMSAFF